VPLRDSLDHPIVFVVFVTISVFALAAIIRWAAKAQNMPGLANMFGG
jgi:hypothetical protein